LYAATLFLGLLSPISQGFSMPSVAVATAKERCVTTLFLFISLAI
jgi:hypothetical protein